MEKKHQYEQEMMEEFAYPSLLQRVQALFIDAVLFIIIFILASQLIELSGGAPGWLRGAIIIGTLYFYEPLLISIMGGTLGHYAIGLRVKNVNDYQKNVFIIFGLIRFFLKTILGWLSFLTVTFNKRKRAIHDLGSGSIVILKSTLSND